MDKNAFFASLCDFAKENGAFRASVIEVKDVVTDESFRTLCKQNACGNYGKSWSCPPDAGEIGELIAALRTFSYMLVYQSVGKIEDSFDFEGMQACAREHARLVNRMRGIEKRFTFARTTFLGAGGCSVCPVCAKKTNEPCRHPELKTLSLETYGVNVSKLATTAGMKYINGQNTVTYFGAVLFDL